MWKTGTSGGRVERKKSLALGMNRIILRARVCVVCDASISLYAVGIYQAFKEVRTTSKHTCGISLSYAALRLTSTLVTFITNTLVP